MGRRGGRTAAFATAVMPAGIVTGAVGCGSSGGRYAVEGRLTLASAPVPHTVVTFLPRNGGEAGVATTDRDGRFVVSTREHRGLVPGIYDVVVEVVPPPVFVDPDVERPGPKQNSPPKPAVPTRYGSRDASPLSIEVKPQRNQVALDLESR
ncbi:MAG: carboxypeptidase-like regulatory domain-containing protein [Planctomycetia bacterium]